MKCHADGWRPRSFLEFCSRTAASVRWDEDAVYARQDGSAIHFCEDVVNFEWRSAVTVMQKKLNE